MASEVGSELPVPGEETLAVPIDEADSGVPALSVGLLVSVDMILLSFELSSGISSDLCAHPERLAAHMAALSQTENNFLNFIKSYPFTKK